MELITESHLTKLSLVADAVLAKLCDVPEGTYLSYTTLTKGLHNYIKANKLRFPNELKDWQAHGYPDAVMDNCGCIFADSSAKQRLQVCSIHESPKTVTLEAESLDIEWPRRCQRCYDKLSSLDQLKSHFQGFHGESLNRLDYQFITENSFKVVEAA